MDTEYERITTRVEVRVEGDFIPLYMECYSGIDTGFNSSGDFSYITYINKETGDTLVVERRKILWTKMKTRTDYNSPVARPDDPVINVPDLYPPGNHEQAD